MLQLICPSNEPRSVLPDIFRFRHRVFIEQANWDIPCHDDMEFDQFDTPDAFYLLWRDEAEQIRAMMRLKATTSPYMIQELWPELLGALPPPVSPKIWEISRFGIDAEIPACERPRITADLALACFEFGMRRGIEIYLGVMPPLLARHCFDGRAMPLTTCAPTRRVGRYRVAAVRMEVNLQSLLTARRRRQALEEPALGHLDIGGEHHPLASAPPPWAAWTPAFDSALGMLSPSAA